MFMPSKTAEFLWNAFDHQEEAAAQAEEQALWPNCLFWNGESEL